MIKSQSGLKKKMKDYVRLSNDILDYLLEHLLDS